MSQDTKLTVRELITRLQALPLDVPVFSAVDHGWVGEARYEPDADWGTYRGPVVTLDEGAA